MSTAFLPGPLQRMEVVSAEPIVYRSVLTEPTQVQVMVCLFDPDKMAQIPKSKRRLIGDVVNLAGIEGVSWAAMVRPCVCVCECEYERV